MTADYFESEELSDLGRKRKNNEDACIRLPEQGVYCVADGMGGVAAGDLASEAITKELHDVFSKAAPADYSSLPRRMALFQKGVNQASRWIKNFADEKVIGQMGSTVVAIVFDPRNPTRAVCMHAGDSRVYRYRDTKLEVLTADHTAVAALAAKLGRDPATLPAKYQNELLRAVGLKEVVELEQTRVEVRSGDLFMLCSDGLSRMVSDEQLAGILKRTGKGPLKEAARALISGANEAGGKDNVTVVLIRIGDISSIPIPSGAEDEMEPITSGASESEGEELEETAGGGPVSVGETGGSYQGHTPHTHEHDQTPKPTPTPAGDSAAHHAGEPATPTGTPAPVTPSTDPAAGGGGAPVAPAEPQAPAAAPGPAPEKERPSSPSSKGGGRPSTSRKSSTPTPTTPAPAVSPAPAPAAEKSGRVPWIPIVVVLAIVGVVGVVMWAPWKPRMQDVNLPSAETKTNAAVVVMTSAPPTVGQEPKVTAGHLYLRSEPAGMQVYLLGQPVGQTPWMSGDMPEGTVTLTYGSMTQTGAVSMAVTAGRTVTNDLEVKARMGTLTMDSDPSGADVWIGGQQESKTPINVQLAAGPQQVTLKYRGLADRVLDLNVVGDGAVQTNVAFAYGSVVIQSEPAGASLTLDGDPMGVTPYTNNLLPAASGNWAISCQDHETTNLAVQVPDHSRTVVSVVLKRGKGTVRVRGNLDGMTGGVDGSSAASLPVELAVEADTPHTVWAEYQGKRQTSDGVRVKMNETIEVPFRFEDAHAAKGMTVWTNSVGMAFNKVPDTEFWVATTRVSPDQYESVAGRKLEGSSRGRDGGQECVINLPYADAEAFAQKLTAKQKLEGGMPPGLENSHFAVPTFSQCTSWLNSAEILGIQVQGLSSYEEWCRSDDGEEYGCVRFDSKGKGGPKVGGLDPAPKPNEPYVYHTMALRIVIAP